MLFNEAKYKVFKCGPNTEEYYNERLPYKDEYGSTLYATSDKWRPFFNDFYYIEETYNHAATLYSNFKLNYYPIGPSGKYNARYADLFKKSLRNMEHVGYYNGKDFDCEIPYLYKSIHELQPLDVFTLEKDHNYRKLGIIGEILTVPGGVELVLEKFDDISGYLLSNSALVSEVKTGKKHKTFGDLHIKLAGKIKLERVYEKL
jgi:hypothetical protein